MAFNTNTAAAPAATPANESWKAQGFINLYLPSKDGKRRKLGAIALKESKVNEKQLLTWLNEDPENVKTLASKLIVEYQSAALAEENAFDLG